MKGQKLWVRAALPEDSEDLNEFFAAENLHELPPEALGVIGRLAGAIVAHASFSAAGNVLRLEHLYVSRELRRLRIGRLFLSDIAKLAAGMQYRSLVAAADCPAAGYLEKRGFSLRGGLLQMELETEVPGG